MKNRIWLVLQSCHCSLSHISTMTKDKTHRVLFMKKIDDGMTIVQASAECDIGVRTGQRWLHMLRRTGNYLPLRVRK